MAKKSWYEHFEETLEYYCYTSDYVEFYALVAATICEYRRFTVTEMLKTPIAKLRAVVADTGANMNLASFNLPREDEKVDFELIAEVMADTALFIKIRRYYK